MSTQSVVPDALSLFREQIAAEKQAKKTKPKRTISATASEQLKLANETQRLNVIAENKFAYALSQIEPTRENIGKLIVRCSGDCNDVERRTTKLLCFMQSRGLRLGHEITLSSDIAFLARLVPDEVTLSDSAFKTLYKVTKVKAPKIKEPTVMLCTLGRRCLRAKRGKAAPSVGKSDYCSPACRGRAKHTLQ